MADLAKAFNSFGPKWQTSDPTAYNAWLTDYNNLKSAYNMASTEAKAEITLGEMTPLISDDNLPAETGYQAVISSLQKVSGLVSPGDFQDVFTRINNAMLAANQGPIVETPLVQPAKGTDTDLNVLQTTNALAKGLPTPAHLGTGIIVGLCAMAALVVVTTIKTIVDPLRVYNR